MALDDRSRGRARNKARNQAQELKGQVKEAAGRATDNPRLEAEGRADQTKANLKQAAEKVKDALRPPPPLTALSSGSSGDQVSAAWARRMCGWRRSGTFTGRLPIRLDRIAWSFVRSWCRRCEAEPDGDMPWGQPISAERGTDHPCPAPRPACWRRRAFATVAP
jgi:uncharacterized protein YjbJ (UPF0337 family)